MHKPLYDWLDKQEGRKDSSFDKVNKERVKQGYKKVVANKIKSGKENKRLVDKNYGVGVYQSQRSKAKHYEKKETKEGSVEERYKNWRKNMSK